MIPVDKKQCQAEKPNTNTFMTLGGTPAHIKRVRCTAKPTVIVKETEPGADGKRGSMSLCDDCLSVFIKQMGSAFAKATQIQKKKRVAVQQS